MDEWKLVKPERELYILINRLRITANAINTFILTGEKDLFIGNTEQDDWFLALKDFYEGNKQFVGAEEPAEVTYGKAHNVKSLDDAKKYWTLQVPLYFAKKSIGYGRFLSINLVFQHFQNGFKIDVALL